MGPKKFQKYLGIYGNILVSHFNATKIVFLQFYARHVSVSSCHVLVLAWQVGLV